MLEPTYDPNAETTYECYRCGTTVQQSTSGSCPDCGDSLRNTAFPIE